MEPPSQNQFSPFKMMIGMGEKGQADDYHMGDIMIPEEQDKVAPVRKRRQRFYSEDEDYSLRIFTSPNDLK